MSVEHVTDHEARGAARLSEQFKDKEPIVALVKSWGAQVQAIEDAAHSLRLARAIATAEGAALDKLGALVGQTRSGRSDSQYRIWIAGRALVNRSRGKAPQLIAIAAKLCGGPVQFRDYYPAGFVIYARAPVLGSDGVEIAKLLKLAKAAGVEMQFVWYDVPTRFRFSTSGESALGSPYGFGNGRLAAVSDGRDMEFLPPPSDEVDPDASYALLVVL